MKNIYDIMEFLPEGKFLNKDIKDLLPETNSINEAKGEGTQLDNMPLSEAYVKDWLFDFDVEIKDFPRKSGFYTLLEPEKELSIFTAQVVNTFAKEVWTYIKRKEIFKQVISEKDKKKIKSKLKGFFGTSKNLTQLKEEKEKLTEFIKALDEFILTGELGVLIQEASDDIILSMAIDPSSGPITKIFTSLKSFFSKSSWQRSLAWLINNIAYNEQHVKWLNTTIYTSNKLSSGITPDVKSAFDRFIVDAGLDAQYPGMESAMPSIKAAESIVINSTQNLPEKGRETWMGALYNTHLFGIYQSLLIIGTCAWVYDLMGDTNIMKTFGSDEISSKDDSISQPHINIPDDKERYSVKDGIKRVRIHYNDQAMKDILELLVDKGIMGDALRKDYLDKFSSPNVTKKGILSNIKSYMIKAVSSAISAEKLKDITKAFDHTGSNLFIPLELFNTIAYISGEHHKFKV